MSRKLEATLDPSQLLREHPFLAGMAEDLLGPIAALVRIRRFESGVYLQRQGLPVEDFFLITKGEISLEISVPHEGSLGIERIRAGEALGWSWMVGPCLARFDARALTAVETIRIRAKELRELCQRNHELGCQILMRMVSLLGMRLDATRMKLIEIYGERQ